MCSTWTGGFVRLSASSATVIPATTTLKLRRLVAAGYGLGFVLAGDDMAPSFARGHAERRCSGPVPAGPFILGPLPPGRAGPRIVPWIWIGQTPRQAATYKYAPSGRLLWPRAGHRSILRRQEGRALELLMLGALGIVAALARSATRRRRRLTQRPAGCRPWVAVWLGRVSPTRGGEEPGGTIWKGPASGRGLVWS
jgi:hypothetical protein